MDELEIPNAAYNAMIDVKELGSWNSWAHVDEAVRAIAAPVVAAELRRLAAKITAELAEAVVTVPADADFDLGVRDVVRELEFRANELVGA